MIKLDDWAEIRHLHSTGQRSKREIARLVGVSRGTVDRALAEDRAPLAHRLPLRRQRRVKSRVRGSGIQSARRRGTFIPGHDADRQCLGHRHSWYELAPSPRPQCASRPSHAG
ncbi:MAG TPA: helix-turn-helix domain-containing protein [Demequina sp.]|nr:helix-turn-helix domain-containing protein [Demequina sp.]